MSWNRAAEHPYYFRCAKCRRNRPRVHDRRAEGSKCFVVAARLTGRTRWRKAALTREYRCTDCGHIGWSSHIELARALPLTRHEAQNAGFTALYGGHRYPIPVESTMGTDGADAVTAGVLISDVHISMFTGKQPANKRPSGKRKAT